jgi:PHD/YefM family antitoxin component YafN of YafNO toxin-antitoxin module
MPGLVRRSSVGGVPKASSLGKRPLRSLEALPQKSATEVKNGWAKVVREVRSSGSVAVTQHDRVEMVVMDAETYHEITALATEQTERRRAALEALTQAFDQRLRSLDNAETPKKFAAVRAAKGRLKHPPKAGSTF